MIKTVAAPIGDLIAEGQAALRSGDAAAAHNSFQAVLSLGSNSSALEGLGYASYLAMDFDDAIDQWQQAYAGYRADDNGAGAVRMARMLGYMYGVVVGDWAIGSGWIARAQNLLIVAEDSSERGWVALTLGMFERDRSLKHRRFEEAIEVASTTQDNNLAFAALAYLGASLVHADRIDEGMVRLDESLAAVAGGEVGDLFVIEEIFCQMFSACERAHDVARAEQWLKVGEIVATRRNLPAVVAYCRTHFGGVMTAAGRWNEAEAALTDAIRLWALGWRTLKKGALTRLADLRIRQGRLEEAEQLLAGLSIDEDCARPLATLLLEQGQIQRAREILERTLGRIEPTSTSAVPLLALLVDVHLAAANVDQAEQAVARLDACAACHDAVYPTAVRAFARGRLAAACDDSAAPHWLRMATDEFAAAQLPLESARSQLELARVLAADVPDVARVEAKEALDCFVRLQAARYIDAAAALLRSLGLRVPHGGAVRVSVLTPREAEVLGLLGHGLSNPEIAERLFISRKTVEHHVGNVLSKLSLRTRGEAAAYAVRTKLGAE
jgi:DNA-binding CsgD family transcriptional regulator/tetratricopeptide (TPR) repeat protein